MSKPTPDPAAAALTAEDFIQSASHRVAVAGLLASDPELRDAQHTQAEWEQRLADYLASPRP